MSENMNRLDAAESIFFARELEHIKAKAYDVKHTQLKARDLIPVSREAGPGAESITYSSYDMVGAAKIIADYANDLPRADVQGTQTTSPVKGLGAAYGYSIQEIRAAQMAGKPLQQRKADAARKAIALAEEAIAAAGDAQTALTGLLNNANVSTTVAGTKTAGGTTWAVATAAEMMLDLTSLYFTAWAATAGTESPDTVLLPPTQLALAATRLINPGISDKSVLEWFKEKFAAFSPTGRVDVIAWARCTGAGTGATNLAFAYNRNPDYVTLEIPQDFEQFPPEQHGLQYVVACHERIGGVITYYPIAFSSIFGI